MRLELVIRFHYVSVARLALCRQLFQAFSHASLINLSEDIGPAEHRKSEGEPDAPAGVGGTSP